MFFSIIIPVYNVAPYLRECLDSVLSQTFTDWEAICVDDGSTDGSGAVLDEYASRDSRIKVVHKANEGVSVARNKGIEICSGEYFMFVDSDDSISSDALCDFAKVLEECNGDCLLIYPFRLDAGHPMPIKLLEQGVKPIDLLIGEHMSGGWPFCRIYKRTKFGHLRFIPRMRLREDMCFWSDVLCVDAKFAVASKPFYRYRERADSASGSVTWRNAADLLRYPAYVINNMRTKMGATDADVWQFWQKEVRGLAIDPYFLSWRSVDAAHREEMVRLYDDVIGKLGCNPCDLLIRFCVELARSKRLDCFVPVVYFVRRCLKKVGLL